MLLSENFLLAAEHIMANDNDKVILCERGVKGFDSTFTRNTLDIAAIPIIKKIFTLADNCRPEPWYGQEISC